MAQLYRMPGQESIKRSSVNTNRSSVHSYMPAQLEEGDQPHDPIQTPPEPLPENVFGVGIACFIRDVNWLVTQGQGESRGLKVARLSFAVGITVFAMSLQLFLIYETKELVTPDVVKGIRKTYGEYEAIMYTDHATGQKHTTFTSNGFERGIPEFFDADNFQHLPDDLKRAACRIPLSQPVFFFVVCMIWTMTCMSDMRENVSIWMRLMLKVPAVESMAEALAAKEDGNDSENVVVGLTWPIRLFLSFGICLPRFLLTSYLLWLGCRWLVATNSFADLILNAVALEFILLVRELLYNTIVPHATKVHTTTTYVPHMFDYEVASLKSYFGMFALLLVACVCTYLYMFHFQAVLPAYRWDIRAPCADFLKSELTGTAKHET